VKVADVIASFLEEKGVRYIFGHSGHGNQEILDALYGSPVRFILVRHEQVAAIMADMYGRLTGFPGVCLVTSGPGATNLTNGLAQAYLGRSPMVAIAGESPTGGRDTKEIDQVALFTPITKWATSIRSPDETLPKLERAFVTASVDPPGPVYVGVPSDIAALHAGPGARPRRKGELTPHLKGGLLSPVEVTEALRDLIPGNAIVTMDTGDHMVYARNILTRWKLHYSENFYSMGFGLPAAMAAKAIFPERPVVCIAGDGGFSMVMQDLETAVREGLPIVVIVYNNRCLSMIKRRQVERYERRYIAVDYGEVDFAKVAEGLGASGRRVGSVDELRGAFTEALSSGKPYVIDVPIDWDETLDKERWR